MTGKKKKPPFKRGTRVLVRDDDVSTGLTHPGTVVFDGASETIAVLDHGAPFGWVSNEESVFHKPGRLFFPVQGDERVLPPTKKLKTSHAEKKLKHRRDTLLHALQSLYDKGEILFTDKCILVNEVHHLFNVEFQNNRERRMMNA